MHEPISWYDNTLARRRRAQRSVTESSTPGRVDPYISGLASAMARGAGRVPLVP
jgi:hypothetical protein